MPRGVPTDGPERRRKAQPDAAKQIERLPDVDAIRERDHTTPRAQHSHDRRQPSEMYMTEDDNTRLRPETLPSHLPNQLQSGPVCGPHCSVQISRPSHHWPCIRQSARDVRLSIGARSTGTPPRVYPTEPSSSNRARRSTPRCTSMTSLGLNSRSRSTIPWTASSSIPWTSIFTPSIHRF